MKFYLSFIFTLTLIFLLSKNGIAQTRENPEIIQITGHVVNSADRKPVRFATIINMNRGSGVHSDSLGFFHFTMVKNDYLKITSMGYYPVIVNFEDSVIDPSKIISIPLKQRVYYLPEVDIFAARWKDFEFEFSKVPLSSDQTTENVKSYILSLVDKEELAMIVASKSIGFELAYQNNRQRQLQKLSELEKRDELDQIASERFNRKLVERLTGLKGEELDRFIVYCDIDKAYILRSNDYDIILRINKKYDDFKKTKQSGGVDFR